MDCPPPAVDDPGWLFDFKYDGFRAICYLEQRRNRLISRNNNAMTRFEALTSQVAAALNIDDAILDGEIIAADETGRPVFIDLLRGTRSPCYIAFDLLWLNGIDLRSLPLASVGGLCRPSYRRPHRSYPRRSPSRAEAASCSI